MALTIQIPPETEQQLKQAAQAAGLSPDVYVAQLIQEVLASNKIKGATEHSLSVAETNLIQVVNHSVDTIDWQRYYALMKKREEETLTAEDHKALIAFSDQVEAANVTRLTAVSQLAKLRNTSVKQIMEDLDLRP